MTPPLVSVIIPAHNAEKTVGYAIASVLEQTVADWELIVTDDASTDRTVSIVSAMPDPRIRLLRSERNIRCAAATNMALRNARGEWASFLDADDEWTPTHLENLLAAARGGEARGGGDCYVADLEVMAVPGPSGRLARVGIPGRSEDGTVTVLNLETALRLRHDVRPMIPVSAFSRSGIEFPEWGSCGQWTFINARLSTLGMQGKLVRRVGYLYRAQAPHDSSSLCAREELLTVLGTLAADDSLPEPGRELLSKKRKEAQEGLVAASLRHGDLIRFLRYAKRYPRAVLGLPARVLLFAVAKIRSSLATAAVSRRMNAA